MAAELGVTESRVSQLRTEALALLRDGLSTHLDGTDRGTATGDGCVARRRAAYGPKTVQHCMLQARLVLTRPCMPAVRRRLTIVSALAALAFAPPAAAGPYAWSYAAPAGRTLETAIPPPPAMPPVPPPPPPPQVARTSTTTRHTMPATDASFPLIEKLLSSRPEGRL